MYRPIACTLSISPVPQSDKHSNTPTLIISPHASASSAETRIRQFGNLSLPTGSLRRGLLSSSLSVAHWPCTREYWLVYRAPSFLAVAGSTPTPFTQCTHNKPDRRNTLEDDASAKFSTNSHETDNSVAESYDRKKVAFNTLCPSPNSMCGNVTAVFLSFRQQSPQCFILMF